MNWFFIAIAAPFLWAIANHIDKYLLSRYVKGGGVGSLIIFSSLFSIVVLPIIAYIKPYVLLISSFDIYMLIFVGILNTLGVLFYLYALNKDDTSVVVAFFQFTPLFGLLFSYILLNETLLVYQLLATGLVIIGAIMLSLEVFGKKIQFKKSIFMYMLASTIFFGLHGTMFKMIAVQEDFWSAIFWEYVGLFVTGIFFLICVRKYRVEFLKLITINTYSVLSLNFFNEFIVLVGNMLTAFVFTIAPVSLVLVIGGYQPFFVLLIDIILIIIFPKIRKENIQIRNLLYRFIAILLIMCGGYLLNYY